MYFDDTLLVPKLEIAPEREIAQTFAPVKRQPWPWVIAAAIVIVTALVSPLVPVDRQVTAQQLRLSVP